MFYMINGKRSINLDHVVEIRTFERKHDDQQRERRDFILVTGEVISEFAVDLDNCPLPQAIIPALPGYFVLTHDHTVDPPVLERVPVLGWAWSEPGFLIPVCLDVDDPFTYRHSPILRPDGRVVGDYVIYDNEAGWLANYTAKHATAPTQ